MWNWVADHNLRAALRHYANTNPSVPYDLVGAFSLIVKLQTSRRFVSSSSWQPLIAMPLCQLQNTEHARCCPFFPPVTPGRAQWGRARSAPTHISAAGPPPDTNADNSSWPVPPGPCPDPCAGCLMSTHINLKCDIETTSLIHKVIVYWSLYELWNSETIFYSLSNISYKSLWCKILSTFEGEIFSAKAVVRCIRSFEYYVGVGVFSESPESIIINLGTGHQPGQRDVRPVHCFIRRCIFKPLIIFALA